MYSSCIVHNLRFRQSSMLIFEQETLEIIELNPKSHRMIFETV